MSGPFQIPQCHAELIDEAAAWLAALDAGTANMAAFEVWRDANIRHAVAFVEVAKTWRDMDALRLAQGDLQRGFAAHSLEPVVDPIVAGRPNRRHVLRAAASVVAFGAVGGGVAYRAAARDTAQTKVGQRKTVVTTPGVSIDLNTDSKVSWRSGSPVRLWLERGEIAVRLAAGCCVDLSTPGGRFQLEPGAYNARLRGAGCELAVLSGRATDGTAQIGLGDVAFANAGHISLRLHEDLVRVTAWRQDALVLNGESLDYALAELNRYLPNKIVIGDPALSRLRLGGTFATTDPAEFLRALRSSFGVRTTASAAGGILLTRA